MVNEVIGLIGRKCKECGKEEYYKLPDDIFKCTTCGKIYVITIVS